jgi:hypothetical protein
MIEDEAKTKWCPFSRFAWPHGATANRDEGDDWHPDMAKATRCIGSACMAWRWETEEFEQAIERYEDSFNIGGITHREKPVCQGHCGLAGNPTNSPTATETP